MFKDLESELQGTEEQQDRLGGQYTLESGVYDGVMKLAYITGSATSKSKCLTTVIQIPSQNDFELTTRTWFLRGADGKPTYEKNGKKMMLPGYELINDMHLVTTGKPITEADIQDKTVKVYDSGEQKEMDKSLPCVVSMLGKPITIAVLRVEQNKQEKNESTGQYEDTDKKITINEIDKVFHTESKRTVVEIMKKVDLPESDMFISKWREKNEGDTRDLYKEPAGSAGPAPGGGSGAPNQGSAGSIFD